MNPVRDIKDTGRKGLISNGVNPVRPCPVRNQRFPNRIWHYTYVLKGKKTGSFYTRATSDLKKRIEEHNSSLVASTKNKRPLQLIYFEDCLSEDDSFRRERYLKTGMGKRYLKNRLKGGLTG